MILPLTTPRINRRCGYHWAEKGFLRHNMTAEERDAMVENTWFISQYWDMHCLIHDGEITPENMKQGAHRILTLLKSALKNKPEA